MVQALPAAAKFVLGLVYFVIFRSIKVVLGKFTIFSFFFFFWRQHSIKLVIEVEYLWTCLVVFVVILATYFLCAIAALKWFMQETCFFWSIFDLVTFPCTIMIMVMEATAHLVLFLFFHVDNHLLFCFVECFNHRKFFRNTFNKFPQKLDHKILTHFYVLLDANYVRNTSYIS